MKKIIYSGVGGFVTAVILIILASFLFSCNPFISKELRQKKRCNRKLERVLKKCPSLITSNDTIIKLDTMVLTPDVKIDTVFSLNFDTLEIFKDKFHLKLIKTTDTLIVDGGCLSDTIYVEKLVHVPIKTIKQVEYTAFERISMWLGKFWDWVLIAFLLFVGLVIVKKSLFP